MLTSEIVIKMSKPGYTTEVTYRTNVMDSERALKELAELLRVSHEAAELELECRSQENTHAIDQE